MARCLYLAGGRLARVSQILYRNIAMGDSRCGRIANGCYHIHDIEVVNMDRVGWYIHLIWKEID